MKDRIFSQYIHTLYSLPQTFVKLLLSSQTPSNLITTEIIYFFFFSIFRKGFLWIARASVGATSFFISSCRYRFYPSSDGPGPAPSRREIGRRCGRPFDRSNRSGPPDSPPRSARFEFFARENAPDRSKRALSALATIFHTLVLLSWTGKEAQGNLKLSPILLGLKIYGILVNLKVQSWLGSKFII